MQNDEIKETFKPIMMKRRKNAFILLKQIAIISILFAIYTHYFAVDNWLLALLYSILSIFVIGLFLFILKIVKYVKANRK